MALKALLDSLDGLSDDTKKLYLPKDGKFQLDVDGVVPKERLDEFRTNNLTLKQQLEERDAALKKFDGVDLTKWKELQTTDQKLRDKQLVDAGKIDELLASKLEPIKKEFQTQLDSAKKEKDSLRGQMAALMIDEALIKIATTKGLLPSAIDDMLARGRRVFTLKDGKPVALGHDGATLLSKAGDPVTMESWVGALSTEAGHLFKSSSGGGANGSGHGTNGSKTITRAEFDKLSDTDKASIGIKAARKEIQILDV